MLFVESFFAIQGCRVKTSSPIATSSDVFEQLLGDLEIEATRAAIMNALRGAIEFGGFYFNCRHLALLYDLMTQRGTLMAITRHGINRADTGALMRCSFEETVENLMEAADVGEKDDCHGVRSRERCPVRRLQWVLGR